MNEFNNRIDAQRAVLEIINGSDYSNEELFGLSQKAIDRWVVKNDLDSNSEIIKLVENIAGKLFFLANKSQQQVTEDYKAKSIEISILTSQLRSKIKD